MTEVSVLPEFPVEISASLSRGGSKLHVGLDLVDIGTVRVALKHFGQRYIDRVYTSAEAEYASQASPEQSAERLAARFAAKEATIKALGLRDEVINWRDMEVWRHTDGRCEMRLHGAAAERASQLRITQWALSLSHDGEYAAAILAALSSPPSA